MEPATLKNAAQLEDELLFVAQHSSTGILRVQFFSPDGEESVCFQIESQPARKQILSRLIDVVGAAIQSTQAEEAAQV